MKNLSIVNLKHIRKEQLPYMQFESSDVLPSGEEQLTRDLLIQQALMLSNLFRHAVKIIFHTKREICVVETTISQRTGKNIILRNNIVLPVHSIYEIVF